MGMLLKKRQVLTATLVVALAAAVAVNWYYNNKIITQPPDEISSSDAVSGNLGDSILVAGTVAGASEETTESTDKADDKNDDKFFSQARLSKSESNDNILDCIDDILENGSLSESQAAQLGKLFEEYKNTVKWQTDAENLIYAKTGSECVVIINEGACQVILQKNTLNDTVILQITEIIEKNTDISAENLSIIESK